MIYVINLGFSADKLVWHYLPKMVLACPAISPLYVNVEVSSSSSLFDMSPSYVNVVDWVVPPEVVPVVKVFWKLSIWAFFQHWHHQWFRAGVVAWPGGARAPPIFGENRVKHTVGPPQYLGPLISGPPQFQNRDSSPVNIVEEQTKPRTFYFTRSQKGLRLASKSIHCAECNVNKREGNMCIIYIVE